MYVCHFSLFCRHDLEIVCEKLLLLDLDACNKYNVEQLLWKSAYYQVRCLADLDVLGWGRSGGLKCQELLLLDLDACNQYNVEQLLWKSAYYQVRCLGDLDVLGWGRIGGLKCQ